MKYVVAEGVSFYNGGKVYAPGDEITKRIFKPEFHIFNRFFNCS